MGVALHWEITQRKPLPMETGTGVPEVAGGMVEVTAAVKKTVSQVWWMRASPTTGPIMAPSGLCHVCPQACTRLLFSEQDSEGVEKRKFSDFLSLEKCGKDCREEGWALRYSNSRTHRNTHCWGWRSGPGGCNLQKEGERG